MAPAMLNSVKHSIKFNKMSVWIEMYVNEKYEEKGYFKLEFLKFRPTSYNGNFLKTENNVL